MKFNPEKTELRPIYDSRKSFYKKAHVITDGKGNTQLLSYDTIVAVIAYNGTVEVRGTYSPTTLRHIKEFLRQNGFEASSKAQIINDYC